MSTAAPEVIRKPQTLQDWLKDFRRSTPRPDRQALIDTMDLESAVAELPRHYRRVVYVIAARAMQWGPDAFPFEARRAIVAAMVEQGCRSAARDADAMMSMLARDHRNYLRRKAKKSVSCVEVKP